jgi:GPI transamidase subunit PIG-U
MAAVVIDTDESPKDDSSCIHQSATKQTSFYNTLRIATIFRCWMILQISSKSSSFTSNNHNNDNLQYWIHQSSNLQSIWTHPMYTVQYIQRAQAIRQLSSSTSSASIHRSDYHSSRNRKRKFPFVNAYSLGTERGTYHHPSRIHLPPLVLLLLETILSILQTKQSFLLFRFFLLFIDGMIAMQFYQLVSNLLSRQQQQDADADAPTHQQNDDDIDNRSSNNSSSEIHIMTHYMNPKLYPSHQMLQIFPISCSSSFFSSFSNIMTKDKAADIPTDDTTGTSTNDTNCHNSTPKTKAVSSLIQWQDLPAVISLLYYMNPITILSTIASSHQKYNDNNICFQNIITLLIIYTLHISTKKRSEISIVYISFLLSILSYIDCHYTILFIPISLFVAAGKQTQQSHGGIKNNSELPIRTVIVPMLVLYSTFTLMLHIIAGLLVGFDNYYAILLTTHLDTFRIANLQPNLSLLWYFGMEVFVPFHRYFTLLLGGLPYFTIIPMTIRLYHYPSVLVRSPWKQSYVIFLTSKRHY